MNYKIKHIVIVLLLMNSLVYSQQDPMYTQYMFNTLAINPAYAGSSGMISTLFLSHHQWVGFEGAPRTQTALVHMPLDVFNSGVGLSIVNDKVGPVHQNMFYADYAYQLKFPGNKTLAMGLKAGFSLYKNGLTSLDIQDAGDESFNQDIQNRFLPNFGLGAYYYTDIFYVGLSAPRLFKNKLDKGDAAALVQQGKIEQHYFFIAGYAYEINPELVFRPSILTKVVNGAPTSFDVNANFLINKEIWLGAMTRIGDSFGMIFQYQMRNNLRAGYSFDIGYTKLQQYHYGTHEIMVGYDFSLSRNKIVSPRYF